MHSKSLGRFCGVDADLTAAQQAVSLIGQFDQGVVPVTPFTAILLLTFVNGAVMMADVKTCL